MDEHKVAVETSSNSQQSKSVATTTKPMETDRVASISSKTELNELVPSAAQAYSSQEKSLLCEADMKKHDDREKSPENQNVNLCEPKKNGEDRNVSSSEVIIPNSADNRKPEHNRDLNEPVTGQSISDLNSIIKQKTSSVLCDTLKQNQMKVLNPSEHLEDPSHDLSSGNNHSLEKNDTSEDIINLLKTLSPEKLKVIKSKIFNDSSKVNENEERFEVDGELLEGTKESIPSAEPGPETKMKDENDIILIDSDDEEHSKNEDVKIPETLADEQDNSDLHVDGVAQESTPEPISEPEKKATAKSSIKKKECINPECTKVVNDNEYIDCPRFTLNFYFITKKANKAQYVCSSCHEKALEKYEEMALTLLCNKPLVNVKLPTMFEMVEIIDSDDEEEAHVQKSPLLTDEKIEWTEETENQMENILQDICGKIDIEKQLEWEQMRIKDDLKTLTLDQQLIASDLIFLERKTSKMYSELYSINKPKITRKKSITIIHEIDPNGTTKSVSSPTTSMHQQINAPPNQYASDISKVRSIQSELVPQNQMFHAVKESSGARMQVWAPCKKIQELTNPDGLQKYRVQFFDKTIATVDGKSFALNTNNEKLQIGARVISQFQRTNPKTKAVLKRFMPGVVGEKLCKYNNYRYLVFCDYGQVQYCTVNEVREISEASSNVWEDVHENLKQFIRDYLQSRTQCQRALLNLRKNQQVSTERNSKWIKAIVQAIDSSIVKMFFPEDNASEWLYRGSKRFLPLFQQGQRLSATTGRRNDPNISYYSVDPVDEDTENQAASKGEELLENKKNPNTARKSTAPSIAVQTHHEQEQPAHGPRKVKILNDDKIYLIDDANNVCKLRHFTPRKEIQPKKYVTHECSPLCLPAQKSSLMSYSPLTKPLLTFWERQIVRQKNNKSIQYKAPCGRRLRNMVEIRQYLMMTKCSLNVDNFDFDVSMQVLVAYDVVDKIKCPLYIPDISEGKEGMKIPAINAFDNTRPPNLIYSASRIPMENVNIVTDKEFLACCDCTDDCADKTKCACFQLTIQSYKFANRGEDICDDDVSYVWKRLLGPVSTGVYECTASCKCSSRCLNKVVQHPIQVKMQLYRTSDRGWGLECCHDIPKGTFVCIYAGRLYSEEDANNLCLGLEHGDEYFAELDLIETATPLKEGYESNVMLGDSDSEDEKGSDSDSDFDVNKGEDDEEFVSRTKSIQGNERVTRSARTEKRVKKLEDKSSNDSGSESEMVNMVPKSGETLQPKGVRSFRKYFGKNERVYIMDAKQCGNVGRYFNHSCDPNLFVQSVLVDTQDIRFPWIAFFAIRAIKAGEELTWNYNYEVGSVPAKVLFCKCGSKNCRGRIL